MFSGFNSRSSYDTVTAEWDFPIYGKKFPLPFFPFPVIVPVPFYLSILFITFLFNVNCSFFFRYLNINQKITEHNKTKQRKEKEKKIIFHFRGHVSFQHAHTELGDRRWTGTNKLHLPRTPRATHGFCGVG